MNLFTLFNGIYSYCVYNFLSFSLFFAILSVEMFYNVLYSTDTYTGSMCVRLYRYGVHKMRAYPYIIFSNFSINLILNSFICLLMCFCMYAIFPNVHFSPIHNNRCALILEFCYFSSTFS